MTQEALPYGGESHPNSGHAGSDTSRERAERDDASGVTSKRQRLALSDLATLGTVGMTSSEFGRLNPDLNMHHGQTSGALSNLHAVGRVARLAERRGGQEVYVLPEYVNGRETKAYRQTKTTLLLAQCEDFIRGFSPCMFHRAADPNPNCRECQAGVIIAQFDARR